MTMLSSASLADFSKLYDVTNFKFNYEETNYYLNQWKVNTTYS